MPDVRTTTAYTPEARLDLGGRASWGAILAGTVVGLAVFAMLALLGAGLGFAAIEVDSTDPLGAVPTASPIWMFLSQLVALGAGGYVAGRLAGVLHGIGAILHGAVVWGLSTLLAAWLAVSASVGLFNMAGSAISMAGSAVSTTASATADAVDAAIPDDVNLPDLAVSEIGLEDLPDPVAARLREAGITPQNFQDEAQEAFRNVISRSEQARARNLVRNAATDILQNPANAQDRLQQLGDALVGGENAVLNDQDREEAIRVMQRRLDLTPQEASNYVDQVEAELERLRGEMQASLDMAQQAFEDAQAAAVDAADEAADSIATAALLAALASLIGLAAAAGGAFLGRPVDLD
ncbi:hypothetical protein [Marivita sp. GX14005]|uniref:hypothetical protein n=1 Tax=Marivita sp. GX14005 TaxID=2942276 RepID=UPI0020190063|nr:hypothetical protein [Marivita sp. GX14005]MCL3882638.1 hypothetical protein [Marivita sp. GX14005]